MRRFITLHILINILILICLLILIMMNITLVTRANGDDIIHVHGVVDDMSLGLPGIPTDYHIDKALNTCDRLSNEKNGITEDCKTIKDYNGN